jgi:DNA-binding protein HU-beta
VNKSDLLRAVATKEGVTLRQAERLVDAFLDVIALSLALEEDVSIRNFGKFEVRERAEVVRKNPRTGEPIPVPAKRGVGFRAAPHLKDRVNGKRY